MSNSSEIKRATTISGLFVAEAILGFLILLLWLTADDLRVFLLLVIGTPVFPVLFFMAFFINGYRCEWNSVKKHRLGLWINGLLSVLVVYFCWFYVGLL